MKKMITWVSWGRKLLLGGAVLSALLIFSGQLSSSGTAFFWGLNSWVLFLVMMVRPLSDLLPRMVWLKFLLPARKEAGILSAVIVLSFALSRYWGWGIETFVLTYFSAEFWAFPEPIFWGRLGEFLALPLLLTSNRWSQRWLKQNWKRVQRLAYPYFFAGSYYVWAAFGSERDLIFILLVLALTLGAAGKKWLLKWRKA